MAAVIFCAAEHFISLSAYERSLRFLSEDKQCHLKEESGFITTWIYMEVPR